MGTRHLIEIKYKNEIKVAQYGQWDGYIEGQGRDILDFLKMCNLEKFKEKVEKCYFITREQIRQYYVDAGDQPANKSGFVSTGVAAKFKKAHPTLSRDVGAKILTMIYESENGVELFDSQEFSKDTFFCEFLYEIDLDDNKLICYKSGKSDKFFEGSLNALPTLQELVNIYEEKNKEEIE